MRTCRATITPSTLAAIIAQSETPTSPPSSPGKIILRICHANPGATKTP